MTRRLTAAWTACSRSTRCRWRPASRPAPPGPASRSSCASTGSRLRHFPQSFEYSTLGGWIATRAGGHVATLYTHIDDHGRVGARGDAATACGESRRLPARARARARTACCIGSEGILGVIVEAWMRVRERAQRSGPPAAVALRRLRLGAPRRCVQIARPASIRRTAACSTRGEAARRRSAGPPAARRLLVLGFESARPRRSRTRWTLAIDAAMPTAARARGDRRRGAGTSRARSGATRGRRVGAWRSAFLCAPYLRDPLVACGVLSETFETAITWDRFGLSRRR